MGMFDNLQYDPWAGWGDYRGEDPNNPAPYQPTPDQNLIQQAIDAAEWSGIQVDADGNFYREKTYTYANPTAWSTGESGNPYEIGGLGYPNSPEGTSTRKAYEFFDKQGNPINKGPLGVPAGFDAPSQGGLIDFVQENGWVVPLALATAGAGLQLAGGAGAASGTGAGAIDSTAAALGGSGGGGAFVPAAGSGASFGIVPGAAYTTSGLGSNALSTTEILGSTGFTPTEGSSFVIDPNATYTTAGLGKTASSLSTAQKLANALKSSGAGTQATQALQQLATGQTGMGAEIPGIVRGNQSPWLSQGQQQPIQTNSKMAAIAKLLQQG